jgi:hypothetical protein
MLRENRSQADENKEDEDLARKMRTSPAKSAKQNGKE